MTVSVLAPDLVLPDFYTRPDYSVTLGPEVVELCVMAGFDPYPEQAMLLDDLFALDAHDVNKSAAFSTGVIAARQQLKTGLLKQACLGWLFITEVPLIVWSAHEFGTAFEAQQDLIGLIEGCPDLSREVAKISVGAGSNEILLKSGSRVRFKARTSGGGRGLTGDKIILDEAYALQPMHLGALLPTLIQVPDPQVVYGSSAGLLKSAVLRGVRDRGRAGTDPKLVYAEWGSDKKPCLSEVCNHKPGSEGCALDDPETRAKACFISARNDRMDVIESLRNDMPPAEFARECLVWWDDPAGDGVFGVDAWNDLETPDDVPVGEPWFAIDVSPGRDWAAIVSAGNMGDKVQVEITSRDAVFDHRPGVEWVRGRVAELREAFNDPVFAFYGGGAVEALVPGLLEDGVNLVPVGRKDMAAACAYFYDLVVSKRLLHVGQEDLTDAVMAARQKQIGDSAFLWIRNGLADLAPLYAACLAVWQCSAAQDPSANVW